MFCLSVAFVERSVVGGADEGFGCLSVFEHVEPRLVGAFGTSCRGHLRELVEGGEVVGKELFGGVGGVVTRGGIIGGDTLLREPHLVGEHIAHRGEVDDFYLRVAHRHHIGALFQSDVHLGVHVDEFEGCRGATFGDVCM